MPAFSVTFSSCGTGRFLQTAVFRPGGGGGAASWPPCARADGTILAARHNKLAVLRKYRGIINSLGLRRRARLRARRRQSDVAALGFHGTIDVRLPVGIGLASHTAISRLQLIVHGIEFRLQPGGSFQIWNCF